LISIKVLLAISVSILGMKAKDFIVAKRPTLAKVTKHPSIGFANYERRLESMQSVMQSIQQAYLGTRERAVVVLEGWDTAGKGGIVRRLGWALDPRSFKVYPIAAPLSHERGRHYLQRFWEKLPDPGQIVVFDRSWYGRVLVERVEGLASKHEWQRGYEEINEFERIRGRYSDCENLLAHNPSGTSAPVQRPAHQPTQALEALIRRFPQSITLGRL
jgi:polyphosphate kinase 2 (PPK2 family)